MGIKDAGRKGLNLFRIEMFLLLFSGALALVLFGDALYSSFISLFFQEFGVPLGEIGFFFTTFSLANALVSIPAGFISDRIGRKTLITGSLLFLAAVVFGYSLAETKIHLYILRALHGASFGFIFPVARAYVMDKTTEENRGQTMGAFIFICTLAPMAAPVAGGFLREQIGSFNPLFYGAALCSVGAVLFLLTAVKDFGTGFTVQKMRLPTRELLQNRIFAVILLMFGMLFFGSSILAPFISIFAKQELGMDYRLLGTLFSVYLLFYAFSQLLAGSLSDRYGRKNLLVYPLFIYAAAILLSGLSTNYWMFFGLYLCVAVGAAPYSTVAYSLIGDAVEPELRGTANGAITTVQNIGMFLGPVVGSALVQVTTLRVPFFAAALVAFVTILMLFVILPQDKRD
ncbi:MAG: MFS transporter [Theionarchaea archaeon]|nr:MAG: hypothetical protein AYK19_11395 [Theionarchaea archaeon DG-70-1]MBU7026450.1 MFS transporter [Theionarchaea archaeon]